MKSLLHSGKHIRILLGPSQFDRNQLKLNDKTEIEKLVSKAHRSMASLKKYVTAGVGVVCTVFVTNCYGKIASRCLKFHVLEVFDDTRLQLLKNERLCTE